MLPSLCALMASIPSVSCSWASAGAPQGAYGGGTGAGGDSDLACMTLAGSIGTRFVARLYSEGPLR
jgi:hypothetical protein